MSSEHSERGRITEVAAAFAKLGCISFGGPLAHIGYVRAEVVEKRRWLDDASYVELVTLCQFLPGPASSQVVFALGMQRAGLAGALVASLCFTLPSAALMIAFAYAVAVVGDVQGAGWLHGLKLAAAAVVAQAVWGMGQKLCTDRARISICVAAAAILLAVPGAFAQIGVIAGGALAGWWLYRRVEPPVAAVAPPVVRHPLAAVASLAVFAVLLAGLPALASATHSRSVQVFDSFYRSGALVFGGGHVVLPLLRAEIVPAGWLSDAHFLAGYGGVQAVPGPMFTFAAYLGAAMAPGPDAWLHGLWSMLALFLPGWLLIGGALPFWHRLRAIPWTHAAFAGANAAVVGVLLAALCSPIFLESVRGKLDVAAVLCAFVLLEQWRVPPWAVVLAMVGLGQWVLPIA